MRRAVGYCTNLDCGEYVKGVFLIHHGDTYICSYCRSTGFVEPETARVAKGSMHPLYTQVQLRFNYDAIHRDYREIAIVTDETLSPPAGSTLVINSPLVRTEKRALKLSESYLSTLAMGEWRNNKEMPKGSDRVFDLNWSKEKWELELLQLEVAIEHSPFFNSEKVRGELVEDLGARKSP